MYNNMCDIKGDCLHCLVVFSIVYTIGIFQIYIIFVKQIINLSLVHLK